MEDPGGGVPVPLHAVRSEVTGMDALRELLATCRSHRAAGVDSAAPESLGVARSLMPCACGWVSAHFQTLLLKELNRGIAFSPLSRWRSFAV